MNYRERFEATIHHRQVDRAPFDLAGTSLTGMDAAAMDHLSDFLGFPPKYDHRYDKFDELILRLPASFP
jgi:hypothetical protein